MLERLIEIYQSQDVQAMESLIDGLSEDDLFSFGEAFALAQSDASWPAMRNLLMENSITFNKIIEMMRGDISSFRDGMLSSLKKSEGNNN